MAYIKKEKNQEFDDINNNYRSKNYAIQGKSSNFIRFYRLISKNTSLEAALLLGHLLNVESFFKKRLYNKIVKQNWYFFALQSHSQERTGLSKPQQKKATDLLVAFNLLQIKYGIGNRLYYKINHKTFYKSIQKEIIEDIENEDIDFSSYDLIISKEETLKEDLDIMNDFDSEY